MKAFIQNRPTGPNPNDQRPFNINAQILEYGFQQRGVETIPFIIQDIDKINWKKEDVVIGGVGTYTRIFKKFGIEWERESYPRSLKYHLDRNIYNMKLSKLHEYLEFVGKPMFVKPMKDTKEFTGFVLKHPDERWALSLAGLDGDTDLIVADVVDFKAEYRVYVLENKIQNIGRYRGSVEYVPDIRIIREMISDYACVAPIAYGLDVGIESDGDTILVETNDALALGNYGIPPTLHAKMLAARWFQLMGDTISAGEQAQTIDSPPYINQC